MDKSILLKAFEANFDNEACRQGTDFIPYTTEDIEALRERDESKDLQLWVPPPVNHPTFWELLDEHASPRKPVE